MFLQCVNSMSVGISDVEYTIDVTKSIRSGSKRKTTSHLLTHLRTLTLHFILKFTRSKRRNLESFSELFTYGTDGRKTFPAYIFHISLWRFQLIDLQTRGCEFRGKMRKTLYNTGRLYPSRSHTFTHACSRSPSDSKESVF